MDTYADGSCVAKENRRERVTFNKANPTA